jgi:hypothetical protein
MRFPAFVGPSYTNRSVNVDCERTINLYPEIVDGGGTGKARMHLVGTPGIEPWIGVPSGPIRALWAMDGRCFAVGASRLYEVFPNRRGLEVGQVAVDSHPATISSNGTEGYQLFVTSGGHGYIYDLQDETFVEISDPEFPTPCSMGLFLDSYFVALKQHSRQFWISDLLDGTSWYGLDVAETSSSPDDRQAMAVSHRELWLFGSHLTEVWRNSGYSSFPFEPVGGVQIEHGIWAPYSVSSLDNTLYWVGADRLGNGQVWRANGYTPERVSTHAVEYFLKKTGRLQDAISYPYQEEGHSFYVLYVPDAETTFVFDVATNLWHERALWDENRLTWTPHPGRCHCFAFGHHLIGDRETGTIYRMALDLYADDLVAGVA